jgi:hypothetical protein
LDRNGSTVASSLATYDANSSSSILDFLFAAIDDEIDDLE